MLIDAHFITLFSNVCIASRPLEACLPCGIGCLGKKRCAVGTERGASLRHCSAEVPETDGISEIFSAFFLSFTDSMHSCYGMSVAAWLHIIVNDK